MGVAVGVAVGVVVASVTGNICELIELSVRDKTSHEARVTDNGYC